MAVCIAAIGVWLAVGFWWAVVWFGGGLVGGFRLF